MEAKEDTGQGGMESSNLEKSQPGQQALPRVPAAEPCWAGEHGTPGSGAPHARGWGGTAFTGVLQHIPRRSSGTARPQRLSKGELSSAPPWPPGAQDQTLRNVSIWRLGEEEREGKMH